MSEHVSLIQCFLVYVCVGVFSYLGKKNSGFVQNGQFFYSVSSKIAHIERGVINLGMKIRKKKMPRDI